MNNTKIFAAIAASALLLTFSSHAVAQEGGYNESVVVQGSYRPVIEQAEKINFPAAITDSIERMQHNFRYSISPSRLKALYEPSRIKAARIVGEPATKLYNNYLRLGFGNYWSPLADLYYCSLRDKKKTYGVRVNHRSSWGSIGATEPADDPHYGGIYGPDHFSRTGATLFGKYIVKDRLQLSADAGYDYDYNLYYGFNDSTLAHTLGTTRDDISTRDYHIAYNKASLNLGVQNMQLDVNKLGYAANLHLSDLWATYGQNEMHLGMSGNVHYGFNIKNQYKGVAYLHAEWDGYANSVSPDFQATRPLGCIAAAVWDTVRGFRNIVKLNPYADFMFSGLQFRTGFTMGWDGFQADANEVAFRFFPDVVVSKKLLRDNLVLSLGATGGFDANSWNTSRLVNPYITPGSELRATRHYDFTGHARWTISRKLEVNAELSYQLLSNDLTYTLDGDYVLRNVYKPLYVDHNQLTAGADIAFVNDEMLTLRAGGHYYAYSAIETDDPTLTLDAVSYRPDWDASLAADVNYHDKWLFSLEARLLGAMQGEYHGALPTSSGTAAQESSYDKLPMRYGIAAEVEYRHNRALSFFLRADNLGFQRYMLWSNYPSQRGLIIAGITYTLPTK